MKLDGYLALGSHKNEGDRDDSKYLGLSNRILEFTIF